MATTTDTASPTPGNAADVADVADAADAANVSTVLFIKLADLDELVEHGHRRQALRQARQLLDHTDGDTRAELADLVESLEQQRDADWVPPQRADLTRWVPPSRVRVHRQAPRTPAQRTWTAQATAGREGDAAAAVYLAERGDDDDPTDHSADGPAAAERPPGYDLDYDLAALAPLRGRPCLNLSCRVERTPADLRMPDGLCRDCRADGHTRASVIADWCAHIAATHPGERARQRLREAWSTARGADASADRAVITEWVQDHPDAFTTAVN